MTVRKEKDGKRRKGRDGCLASYERKNFGPALPQLILSLLLRDERVEKMEVSEVSDKHSVSIPAKAGRCSSDSSSASGGENKNYGNSRTELQKFRERIKRYEGAVKKQGTHTQCELAGEEGRLEEDGKM